MRAIGLALASFALLTACSSGAEQTQTGPESESGPLAIDAEVAVQAGCPRFNGMSYPSADRYLAELNKAAELDSRLESVRTAALEYAPRWEAFQTTMGKSVAVKMEAQRPMEVAAERWMDECAIWLGPSD